MMTCMACPVCHKENLQAECRSISDGTILTYAWCECGYRIGAGKTKSDWPFDVEAAVAKALERDGMVVP